MRRTFFSICKRSFHEKNHKKLLLVKKIYKRRIFFSKSMIFSKFLRSLERKARKIYYDRSCYMIKKSIILIFQLSLYSFIISSAMTCYSRYIIRSNHRTNNILSSCYMYVNFTIKSKYFMYQSNTFPSIYISCKKV